MTSVIVYGFRVAHDEGMARENLRLLRLTAAPQTKLGPNDRANVDIYKPFFTAGILSVLIAGCTLGAIALLGISLRGDYTASAWTPYVLAHANSQLFGWVGFFIMGFALQQHAPAVRFLKLYHGLAYCSLGFMSAGIALRFIAEPMTHVDASTWVPIGVFSGVLQGIAASLFLANSAITRHRTAEPMPWQSKFVLASMGYLFLIAWAEPWVFLRSHQADPSASIQFVAEYFPVMRELQFLGFVALMIFGVALVKLNSCFGFKPANRGFAEAGFLLWNAGILLRIFGWKQLFHSGMENGSSYHLGGLTLVLGAVAMIIGTEVFGSVERPLRTHKFIRAAFTWLVVGGILMALEPFHLRTIGMPFSHAYTGAIRHALTVGFISQMIIGVGMHVVATLNSRHDHLLNSLQATFWLLNVGNAARVFLEIGTDYSPRAFLPMGFTGFVELTGLVLWGGHILSILFVRRMGKVSYAK